MLRFTMTLVTLTILLSGSSWARPCPTRIPPGHYYCYVHNEICTHGLSTPEIAYNRPYQRPVVVNNGYGYEYRNNRCERRWRRKKQRRYRRYVRQNNRVCR